MPVIDPATGAALPLTGESEAEWRIIGQAFRTFIFIEKDREILVVDQHTAHERILFEEFKANYRNRSIPCQTLLFPIPVELEPRQRMTLAEFKTLLVDMGVIIEEFGKNAYIVRALPQHLKQESPEILLRNLADELILTGSTDRNRAAERRLLITLACRRAIKAGDRLDREQMEVLVRKMMDRDLPATCPHGRPIIIKMDRKDLETRFKR